MYIVCEKSCTEMAVGCANWTSVATSRAAAARSASRTIAAAGHWRKAGAVAAAREAVGAAAAGRPDTADAAGPGVAVPVVVAAVAPAGYSRDLAPSWPSARRQSWPSPSSFAVRHSIRHRQGVALVCPSLRRPPPPCAAARPTYHVLHHHHGMYHRRAHGTPGRHAHLGEHGGGRFKRRHRPRHIDRQVAKLVASAAVSTQRMNATISAVG